MFLLSELDFEGIEEFEVVEAGEGSKYRATVLKFLGSGLEKARIQCNFINGANVVRNGLTRWTALDEPIRYFSRGRIVYLVRTSK